MPEWPGPTAHKRDPMASHGCAWLQYSVISSPIMFALQNVPNLDPYACGGRLWDLPPHHQRDTTCTYMSGTCDTLTYLPHINPCQKACNLWRNVYFYMYFSMYSGGGKTITDTLWFSMAAGWETRGERCRTILYQVCIPFRALIAAAHCGAKLQARLVLDLQDGATSHAT